MRGLFGVSGVYRTHAIDKSCECRHSCGFLDRKEVFADGLKV